MPDINSIVNWGIIGCGDVCEVKSGPAFNKVPGSKLVAVMRRNREKARDFAERHNVAKYYSDAVELVNDDEVNAVYIATPPSSHEAYLKMGLEAGKPVYVEKLVTTSAASLERMIEMEMHYNGKVSVAHYRRSLPFFTRLRQLVHEGTIGNVKLILLRTLQPPVSKIIIQTENNWRINPEISGGGIFHDLSPHQLDILYWIFGAPKRTHVQAANQGKLYNAPDLTTVELVFDNEIYFNGVWNFNVSELAAEDICEIIGDKGRLRFSFFQPGTIELANESGIQTIKPEFPLNIQQPHINNVVKFFLGMGPNPCSLNEALVTMRVIDKAVI